MATPTDITTGIQTVTTTGAVTPTTGFAVSGVTGDFTLVIEVSGLTDGNTEATIQLEASTNGFANSNPLVIWNITGQTASLANPIKKSWRKYELPSNLESASGGVIRANVTALSGSSPSLSLHAWIEQ